MSRLNETPAIPLHHTTAAKLGDPSLYPEHLHISCNCMSIVTGELSLSLAHLLGSLFGRATLFTLLLSPDY